MEMPYDGRGLDLDRREVLTATRDVLGDLVEWKLAPSKWSEVEQVLESLAAALEANDLAAANDAFSISGEP